MSNDIFKEGEENVIGQISVLSRGIVLADGLIRASLIPGDGHLYIETALGDEAVVLPVVATRQGGKRYLLIPLDDGVLVPRELTETVVVERDEDNNDTEE